jgi:hypothetical protein
MVIAVLTRLAIAIRIIQPGLAIHRQQTVVVLFAAIPDNKAGR